jgi:hypothetical protein
MKDGFGIDCPIKKSFVYFNQHSDFDDYINNVVKNVNLFKLNFPNEYTLINIYHSIFCKLHTDIELNILLLKEYIEKNEKLELDGEDFLELCEFKKKCTLYEDKIFNFKPSKNCINN